MNQQQTLTTITRQSRALTAPEFQGLAAMPAELEWFANIDNPRTRRAYRIDVASFMAFVGIQRPEEFRIVTRAHFIAWRRDLEGRGISAPTSLSAIHAAERALGPATLGPSQEKATPLLTTCQVVKLHVMRLSG